jgi:hypothetical protein
VATPLPYPTRCRGGSFEKFSLNEKAFGDTYDCYRLSQSENRNDLSESFIVNNFLLTDNNYRFKSSRMILAWHKIEIVF